MNLEEYESYDLECLIRMKGRVEFQVAFGPTKIQRHLKIGYNRSLRLIHAGIQKGLLLGTNNSFPVTFK